MFIARRRALRPSEEYREPTDGEWNEFLAHFEKRKVELGLQGRDESYVKSGLSEGEKIVAAGALLLQSELASRH